MKSLVGKILRKLLPFKYYKLVANGFIIVPSYYKTIIKDAETYMDLSLKDSPEKDILLMRKYAHILDKGLHRSDLSWAQKNIQENLQLRKLLSIPDDCIIVFCAVIGYPLYRYQIPTRKDIK